MTSSEFIAENDEPLVTVAVPTKNSAKHLRSALESILAQHYSAVELIIVDNYSTDETKDIALQFSAKFFQHGPERSAQLNRALREAHGKYFYRMDSDFIAEPTLVGECVALCEHGEADMVATFVKTQHCATFWERVSMFERAMYRGDRDAVGARFIRTDMLRAVGGFDEDLVAGEDYDVHNRLLRTGAKLAFSQAAELNLDEPSSLRDVWQKSVYYGRTFWTYVAKHPGRAMRQTPIRAAFLRNWRSFLAHPILGAALFFRMFLKIAGAVFGGLVARVESARMRRAVKQ